MKKFIVLVLISLFLPLLAQAANQQVDPQDFGKLVREVKGQDQDIDRIMNILKGMDKALQNNKGTTPASRSQGPIQGGTTIINDQDNQARRIGNRALAWAIYSQVVDKDGKKPDIEDVERMLTPLEKGNMAPLAFENGLAAALKTRGWKLVDPGTPLCPEQIKKICDEAIAKTLKELTEKVDKLEKELAEVRKIAEQASMDAKAANEKADKAMDTAATASDTAVKALTTATGIQIPAIDMSVVRAEAKATAEATARAIIPDTSQFTTKADLDATTKCLEKKIDAAKADAEAVGQALTRAFNTNDKDKARAELYSSLMERYQKRGYKGESAHGMAQVYLRSCYWSEALIEKAAKDNGAKLVDVSKITPPSDPPK
ncbi:MAG: alanine-zipper protein [Candidatus Doudnabacteria bacterium]